MAEIKERVLAEVQNAIDQCEGALKANKDEDGMWTESLEAWKYVQAILQRSPKGEVVDLRPEVLAFAKLMETKLRGNDFRPGWKDCTPKWAVGRIEDELEELQDAMNSGPDGIYEAPEEAVDVANFCMMFVDLMGGLSYIAEEEDGS